MSFLYDQRGKRKYLTIKERADFLDEAAKLGTAAYSFCATLAFTGARISEVLSLSVGRVDFVEGVLIFECLKKRRPGIFRAVPVPKSLLIMLEEICSVRTSRVPSGSNEFIWTWSRTTAWKFVKQAMTNAGITGPCASPKGLRHCFGVSAIQCKTPLNMVQKWLGHSRITTTAIYADAMGSEERMIAKRFWKSFDDELHHPPHSKIS